ncbi:hypothetical protein VTI74DRAFT_11709 [Chaetomium olivicolor]
MPERFFMPLANNSGRSSGSWMVSVTASLTLLSPPTSSQVTFGILGAPMASAKFLRAASTATSKSCFVRPEAAGPPATCTSRTVTGWPSVVDFAESCSRRERWATRALSTTSTRSPATSAAVLRAILPRSTSGSRLTPRSSRIVRRIPSRSPSSGALISSSWVKRALIPSGTFSTSVVVAMRTLAPAKISLMEETIRSAVKASICRMSRAQQSAPQLMARSAREVRKPAVLTSLPPPPESLTIS